MDSCKLGPDIVVSIKCVGKGPQRDNFMIQLDVWCVRACDSISIFRRSTAETNLSKEEE